MYRSLVLLLPLALGLLYGCGSDSSNSSSSANFIVKGGSASKKNTQYSLMANGGGGTPASFNAIVTKLWVSQNANCSDPILVGDVSGNPQYSDFVNNPTLLTGSVPAGVYECVIFQMYDTILFTTPSAINGGHTDCAANTTYGMDIFRDPTETWYDFDNDTTMVGAGNENDVNDLTTFNEVENYTGRQLTTTFASTGGGADIKTIYPDFHFDGGTEYYQLLQMSSSITVPASGTKELTMTYNFDNLLDGDNGDGNCWVEGPTLSIQ